jgi:hypothetical protein
MQSSVQLGITVSFSSYRKYNPFWDWRIIALKRMGTREQENLGSPGALLFVPKAK